MELCDQCTTLEASETPRWGEFLVVQLLWPSLAQLLLTFTFVGLSLVYRKLSRQRASVRIFLQRYVGTPDRLKVTNPRPQLLIQWLRLCAALVETYMYARKTYLKGNWYENGYVLWELLLSGYFIFTHFVERLQEGFRLKQWNPKALVDVFVIVPLCFPYDLQLRWVPFQRQWLSIGFLRIITALDAFRSLQELFRERQREDTVLGRCVLTILRLAAMIVCMAGTMFALEVLGEIPGLEDSFVSVGMGDLSIVQMIYWITTTISTVGYGDFSPTTVPARIVIIFFIFGGVIFFGSETTEIVDLFNEAEQGRGSYMNTWRQWLLWLRNEGMQTHILIVGNGCHMSSPLMETLLLETLTDVENVDLVFLSDKEYDFDLKAFVETELAAGQADKVVFLRGSVLNTRDLERAQAKTSKLCFVLPDHTAEDEEEEDSANLMMSLALLRHSPKMRLRLMLLQPKGVRRAVRMGIPAERCFSAKGMKCALFAHSTRIRGLVTFLSSLLQVHTNFADEHVKYLRENCQEHWRIPYSESLRWDLNGLILKDFYCGKPFSEVLDVIYRESKGKVMLIAALDKGRLILNYEQKLGPEQVVVAMAQSPKALVPFKRLHGEDWTQRFLRARSERLEREAHATMEGMNLKETLDLVQVGARRRALGGEKSTNIFEVGGEEAFKLLDKNHDGCLDKEEFEKALAEHWSENVHVANIEELRERSDLTLLLVRDCEMMWSEVECFLSSFQKDGLLKEVLPERPIVIMSSSDPPQKFVKRYESTSCCFVKGDLFNIWNLRAAGARTAANIICIGRKVFPKNSNLPDAALGDSSCVELSSTVDQALDLGLRVGQSQLFEFSFTQSVFLMSKVERKSIRAKTSCIFPEDASYEPGRSEVAEKDLLILNESFAAGQAFTLDFFGGLFGHIHRFPAAIEFLQAIISPGEHCQSSCLWQIRCPMSWVGRSFGDLVHSLVTGEGREEFGSFQGCSIPVALYRESRRRHLPPSCAGFNCTVPPKGTLLEAEDFITVLGTCDFALAVRRAGHELVRASEALAVSIPEWLMSVDQLHL